MADDVKNIVLNDWGSEGLTTSVRTRASGKERVTIEIRGEALLINTDEHRLMKPIAEALRDEIKRGVRMFHGMASQETRKFRERAAKAYQDGAPWARKRYGGGRIGALAPNTTGRLLNDSGRLEKSIAVGTTNAKEHVVNVAANRLGPDAAVRQRTLDLLKPIVLAAMKSDAAAKGVEKAKELLIQKKRDQMSDIMGKLKGTLEAAGNLARAGDEFGEEPRDDER
jgi:hypothetical protein